MRRVAVAAILLSVAAGLRAQDAGDYRIGPRDLLEVRVFQIPELNVERRVSGDGKIDLPLIGEFPVSSLTADEVKDRLEAMLEAKYVNHADLSVTIKEFANKPITVTGAVQRSGNLGGGRWTLVDALTASGGLTEAAGKKIRIFRRADSGVTDTLTVTTDALYGSSDPKWNIPIIPGDSITVPGHSTVTVYCLGEVKNQGPVGIDSDEPISLLKVIVKAGGLTQRASSALRIKRKQPDGKVAEIKINYGRILSGKDPDVILQPEDIILVKESIF